MHQLVLHLLLLAAPAAAPSAPERIAVLAVHDPPAPDGELTELAHQLRAASVERSAGVLTAPEMRDRLAGRSGGATVQELDRAFGGALAVYQNGEFESAARTLRAIVADLEELPEGEAVWSQWTRAMMRLSHVHLSMKQPEERDAVQVALLKVDSSHQLDPVLYAPGFRGRFEELRQRVRAMPKRRLTVTARGRAGTIYVSGRDVGPTPATVILPAGTYRVAGAAGVLRIPSFEVDLTAEDRSVVLDFALAETFRPGAGPGMVLPAGERAPAIIRAGAWLGAEKLVVASRGSEGGAQFLVGAIYDVRRGALLREGSVRMVSGSVPGPNLGALAAFLLTGQSSREVLDRTREPAARGPSARHGPPPPPPPPPIAQPVAPPAPTPQVTFIPAASASTAAPPRAPPVPAARVAVAAPAQSPGTAPAPSSPPPQSMSPTHGATALPPPTSPPVQGSLPSATPTQVSPSTAAPPPTKAPRPAVAPVAILTPAPPPPPPAPDLHPAPAAADPLARSIAAASPEPDGAAPRPVHPWRRPALIGAGVLSAALAGLAIHQGVAAHGAYADADAMVVGGAYRAPYTRADHDAALHRGDAANRNAWLAATGALVSAGAGAAVYLLWGR